MDIFYLISVQSRARILQYKLRFPNTRTYALRKRVSKNHNLHIYDGSISVKKFTHSWRYYYHARAKKVIYHYVLLKKWKNQYGKIVDIIQRYPVEQAYHEFCVTPHNILSYI